MLNISVLSGDSNYCEKVLKLTIDEPIIKIVFMGNSYLKFFTKSNINKTNILIIDKDFGNIHLFTLIQKVRHTNPGVLIVHIVEDILSVDWPSLLSSGVNALLLKKMKKSEIFVNLINLRETGALVQPEIAKVMLNYFATKSEITGEFSLKKTSIDVLYLLSDGLKYEEISEKLGISLDGVRYHIKQIYKTLGVSNKGAAIAMFLKGHVAV